MVFHFHPDALGAAERPQHEDAVFADVVHGVAQKVVRLNVTDDGTIPVEAKDKAAKVPEQCHLKAKFCLINRVKKVNAQDINSSGKINISTAELGKMGPYSVAELYLKETGQEGIDENILALLKETIDEVMNPEKHD